MSEKRKDVSHIILYTVVSKVNSSHLCLANHILLKKWSWVLQKNGDMKYVTALLLQI